MNTSQTGGWALAFALGLALGCSREANGPTPPPMPPPPPPAAPSAEAQPPPAERPAARMQHRDATEIVLKSAEPMQLTDAQRATLHTLEENLQTSGQAIASAFQVLRTDLADQVRSGAIDAGKVQSDEAAVTSAIQAHVNREIDGLDALHTMLDPTERGDLVTLARSQESGPGAGMPHGAKSVEGASQRLDRLTQELDLDQDQRARVSAMIASEPAPSLPPGTDGRQRLGAILDAFSSDSFDARPILEPTASTVPGVVREHVQRKTAFLMQLVPILRPDQRERLASDIQTGRGAHGPDEGD